MDIYQNNDEIESQITKPNAFKPETQLMVTTDDPHGLNVKVVWFKYVCFIIPTSFVTILDILKTETDCKHEIIPCPVLLIYVKIGITPDPDKCSIKKIYITSKNRLGKLKRNHTRQNYRSCTCMEINFC